MALRESAPAWSRALRLCVQRQIRQSSTAAAVDNDLVVSSLNIPPPSDADAKSFDPVGVASRRRHQLPPSRYKFRPPKYYRGPLHPHQPPPPTDIASREFVPGPFTVPRLQEHYDATLASDMLALTYTHVPPGTPKREPTDRVRHWVGDSPYFENRSPKGPRGRDVLLPLHKPINWNNIPAIKGVVVHTHAARAVESSAWLHTASLALQSITNVRCDTHIGKKNVMEWGAKKGKWIAATATMENENMYDFLSKLVEIVLPRIKDWKGVSAGSGDSTGNISFGLEPEVVALFPEIEVNYDMYPPEMIPGCHITIQTTAKTDREARLLLSTLGIPFFGKAKKR